MSTREAAYRLRHEGGPRLEEVRSGGRQVTIYERPYRAMLEGFRGRMNVDTKEIALFFEREYGISRSMAVAYLKFALKNGTAKAAKSYATKGVEHVLYYGFPSKYGGTILVLEEDESSLYPEERRKAGMM